MTQDQDHPPDHLDSPAINIDPSYILMRTKHVITETPPPLPRITQVRATERHHPGEAIRGCQHIPLQYDRGAPHVTVRDGETEHSPQMSHHESEMDWCETKSRPMDQASLDAALCPHQSHLGIGPATRSGNLTRRWGRKVPLYSTVGTYKQPESTSTAKTSYSTLSRHFFCMEPPVPQHPTGRRRRMHLDRLPCLPPARVRTCSEHDTHNESDVRYIRISETSSGFEF